jgi:Na+-driven multidrug efflux pump
MVFFKVDEKDFLMLLYLFILSEIIFYSTYAGGTIMLMTGQIKYLILIKIICVVTFFLSLLFSYNYGLIGAGLSFVLVRTVQTILLTFYSYRQTKLNLNLIQNYKYVFQKK